MSLLTPLGLVALAAIPLIILFHMRHTTPPRRPVASLRFWMAANPRPAEDRRLRPPPLSLPLLLQIAAVALLALALARPATAERLAALAPGLRSEPQHLIILLDGSTSMSATAGAGSPSRWEAARTEALARLAPLREGDVATVILMGTRPLTFTATDNPSLVALRERLATLPQPGGRADLNAALTLASDLHLPNLERRIVIIGDGASTADPAVVAAADAPIELVIAGGDGPDTDRANIAVTDISARPSPDGTGTVGLFASVVNFGPRPVTVPVSLLGDGLEVGRHEVTLAGNGDVEFLRWVLPPGIGELTVQIDHPDALIADNRATLLPGERTGGSIAPRILLVSDLPGAVARALMALDNVQVTIEPADNLAVIAAGGYDLVVFDRTAPPSETLARVESPSLWIAPPVGGPFPTGEGIADPTVTRARAGDPVLEGVDLAGVTFGPTPVFALGAADIEIVGAAEGPLLYRSEINGQPALVLTVDPESSNLPKRVAFPVLIANMVAELAPDGIPNALPLGEPLVYEPRVAAASVEIVPPLGEPALITVTADATERSGARQVVYTDTGVAGAYTVTESDAAGAALGSSRLVINAGHPRESDLRVNPTLATTLADASGRNTSAPLQERIDLWPLLALGALLLVLAEWGVTLWPASRRLQRPVDAGARS